MSRVAYFMATNIGVMLVLTMVMAIASAVFGINIGGGGYLPLAITSLVIGMTGSVISLFMSKKSAIRGMNVQLIEQPSNATEQWLLDTVHDQAERMGIGKPEVGVYQGAELNAFATGANRNNALVAVSTGLLSGMEKREVEAVLAHEVAHVANGDMITLTLIQGVVNTFVFFFARLFGSALSRRVRGGYWIGTMVAQTAFGFLATLIVMYFSRRREFRADQGGAELTDSSSMAAALERLRGGSAPTMPAELRAFGISGGGLKGGMKKLFTTHPPLEDRIAKLRQAA